MLDCFSWQRDPTPTLYCLPSLFQGFVQCHHPTPPPTHPKRPLPTSIYTCWALYHTNKERYTAHTGINRMAYPRKYILIPPVLFSQQLSVLHSINNQKFTLQCSTMSWLFKNHWLVEVTYHLIRFNKINLFIWNTKNSDRYGVNT